MVCGGRQKPRVFLIFLREFAMKANFSKSTMSLSDAIVCDVVCDQLTRSFGALSTEEISFEDRLGLLPFLCGETGSAAALELFSTVKFIMSVDPAVLRAIFCTDTPDRSPSNNLNVAGLVFPFIEKYVEAFIRSNNDAVSAYCGYSDHTMEEELVYGVGTLCGAFREYALSVYETAIAFAPDAICTGVQSMVAEGTPVSEMYDTLFAAFVVEETPYSVDTCPIDVREAFTAFFTEALRVCTAPDSADVLRDIGDSNYTFFDVGDMASVFHNMVRSVCTAWFPLYAVHN